MSFLAPQPTGTKPQVLTTMSVQTSAYGVCIPMVWGTTRLTGNLIWYGDFVATEHNETQGGKGGGVETTNYTYSTAFAMGLAGVEVVEIQRVWSGKEKSTLGQLGLELKSGAAGQAAWSYLTVKHPTEALKYPGLAYVASGNFQLGATSSLPNLGFEVKTISAGVAGGMDAAPWVILQDLFSAARVDESRIASMSAYTNFCGANGLFISPALTEQKRAADYVSELLEMTHTAAVPSEGKLKLVPYGDTAATGNGYTFTPNVTPIYDLSDDDFLPIDGELPIHIERKANADAKNRLRVEFKDRTNDYAAGVVQAEDAAHIAEFGAKPEETLRFDAIKSSAVASKVAYLKLQKGLYSPNTYKFKLPWRYCLLEPMDIVTLTHSLPALDLDHVPVRITKVEEDSTGGLTMYAEDFPQGAGLAPLVAPQPTTGYSIDMNVAPGAAATPVMFEPPITLAGDPEVWMATSGGATYGGCDVWVSLDNVTYQRVGTLAGKSRHGITTATLPTSSDPDTTSTLSVDLSVSGGQLISGTDDDRDLYNTLLWVAGELISYKNAALVGVNRYNLTSLRRGVYGTAISGKSVGAKVVRCDDRVFRYQYDPALIGKTIYVKLQAFNIYGSAYQDLSSVAANAYVIQGAPLGAVSGLALEQPFVGTACSVKWNPYKGASSYLVEVWSGGVKRRTVAGLASPRFSYTYEDGKADGGPFRALEFRVFAVSANGQSGAPAVVTASNPQLGAPTGIATVGAGASISISANRPTASDYGSTRIWLSWTSGFDPAATIPVYDGPDAAFTQLGLAAGTWYARIAQYDVFGADGMVTSGEIAISVTGANGVRTVTALPANPAAVGGELAIFLDVVDANTRGIYGWDGSAWKFTRDGANLLANSIAADRLAVSNLAAIKADMGAVTSGSFTVDASGFIRGGQTGYNAGTGFWLGYSGGAYKFSLGSASRGVVWDGTDLSLAGSLTIGNTNHIKGGAISLASGTGFWMGYDAGWYKVRIGTASGARMEWTGSAFNVYDSSGNLTISSGVVDYQKLMNRPSLGRNLCPNSDLGGSAGGWSVWTRVGGTNLSDNTPIWQQPNGAFSAGAFGAASTAWNGGVDSLNPAGSLNMYPHKLPVVAGQRLEAQALIWIAGGFADLCVSFLDGNYNYVTNEAVTGGVKRIPDETIYGQAWGFVTVPANARWAYLEAYTYRTRTDRDTSLLIAKPWLGYASSDQVDMSPWQPGPSQIHAGNVSTYIGNLAVDTLQIAEDAVVVPIRFEAYVAPAESPGATGILTEIGRTTVSGPNGRPAKVLVFSRWWGKHNGGATDDSWSEFRLQRAPVSNPTNWSTVKEYWYRFRPAFNNNQIWERSEPMTSVQSITTDGGSIYRMVQYRPANFKVAEGYAEFTLIVAK